MDAQRKKEKSPYHIVLKVTIPLALDRISLGETRKLFGQQKRLGRGWEMEKVWSTCIC